MVNPGRERTMLGQWRIVIKQAETAAKAGRFDEALAFATRPDVAEHRLMVGLRNRLAQDLVGRGARRAEADDTVGAISDLDLAEKHGAPPDLLAAARMKVAEREAEDVKADLDAGDPAKVADRVAKLAQHHISGPILRRMRDAADAWKKALDDARRGEFGLACEGLERAARLAGGLAVEAIAASQRDLSQKRDAVSPRIERLYAALGSSHWPETLAASEAVLELVSEHPAAKQARARAWQQIAALNPSASLPGRAHTAVAPTRGPLEMPAARAGIVFLDSADKNGDATTLPWQDPLFRRKAAGTAPATPRPRGAGEGEAMRGRFLLWADVVGAYLVCLNDEVVLGRAGADSAADVPLLGDLSRQHAAIIRDGDGYILKARHTTCVNGRKVETAPLRNGDVIRLGSTVEVEFHQPSPVSSTARLRVVSRHRLPLAVDGVILMAETCIVGPSPQAHIPAPNLDAPVVLYRQGSTLWCRAPGEFEVDGRSHAGRAPLTLKSSVLGEGFSFSLEPLPAPRAQA